MHSESICQLPLLQWWIPVSFYTKHIFLILHKIVFNFSASDGGSEDIGNECDAGDEEDDSVI